MAASSHRPAATHQPGCMAQMAHMMVRLVAGCWLVLGAVWVIAAGRAKKTLRAAPRWSGPAARFGLVVLVWILIGVGVSTQPLAPVRRVLLMRVPGLEVVGALLCVCGVAFAIWARVHIGRNWGMPMSLRQGHELVTTGPYAYVRHPIYSGILLTMLGTALAVGAGWLLGLLLFGAYFLWSARAEERDMAERFPATYPAYRQRTRRLIPFLL